MEVSDSLIEGMLASAIENCNNQQHGFHDDDFPLCKACILTFARDYADAVHD